MGGNAFKRASQGGKLEIPAAAWNACLDAAEANKTWRQLPDRGTPQLPQTDIVFVKNVSGYAVGRFYILGVGGFVFPLSTAWSNANLMTSFGNQIVLEGVNPTAAHRGNFVVCLDPIAPGEVGRGCISGVCMTGVIFRNPAHKFAEATPNGRGGLLSSDSGTARILAYTTASGNDPPVETDFTYAIVRLGEASATHRLCKTTSSFPKNTVATLDVWEAGTPPSETQTTPDSDVPEETVPDVINKFAAIGANKFVSVARHNNGRWYVVAAEC
jgi:hypothetical protein